MTCHNCSIRAGKYGKHRNGAQRYRCNQCGRTFTEEQDKPLDEMRIPEEKAVLALRLLTEGCSIRSTSRLTGLEKKTVLSLILLAGEKCRRFMDRHIRKIRCSLIQADEIWTYCHTKQKRVKWSDPHEWGDQYVFVAIDPESKLVLAHEVGKRDGATAYRFMRDLKGRLDGRIQLSTDLFRAYIGAVEDTLGADVDYGVLVNAYSGEVGRLFRACRPPGRSVATLGRS